MLFGSRVDLLLRYPCGDWVVNCGVCAGRFLRSHVHVRMERAL